MPLYHVEDEKDRHIAAIIQILNEVDSHVKQLKDLQGATTRHRSFVMQDAAEVLHKCFYKCQVAEEQIKLGYARGFIKRKHMDDLNRQLQGAVQRIVAQVQQSELLTQVLRDRFGADVTE